MKYDWNPDKNEWLIKNRDISFEEIIYLIGNGELKAILEHPQKSNQKIFVVEREGYAYNVPYVEQENATCFLKTIYPSCASTKRFIGE